MAYFDIVPLKLHCGHDSTILTAVKQWSWS